MNRKSFDVAGSCITLYYCESQWFVWWSKGCLWWIGATITDLSQR